MNRPNNKMSEEAIQISRPERNALVIGQHIFRSSTDWSLNEFDLEIARKELNETEDKKDACLKELKEKLSKENIKYRTDDDYLLRYLRMRKYDCGRAFKTLHEFYSKRETFSDTFSLPSNLDSLLNIPVFVELPFLDERGRIIFLNRYERWIPGQTTLKEHLSAGIPLFDISSMNPHIQIHGFIGVWDVKGAGFRHVPQFLKFLRFIASLLQDLYPWRMKLCILLNCSSLHQMLYQNSKFLLKKKISERVKFLGSDYSELHKYVNPAILPKEYGGELEENQYSMKKLILDNLPYLKYERSFVSAIHQC